MAQKAAKAAGITVGGLLAVLVVASAALATQSDHVEGHSMEPTLHDGDRVIAAPNSAGQVHRFDVVLFAERGVTIVKRVIAVPGDRVEIRGTAADPYQVLLQEGGTGPWYRVSVPGWSQTHTVTPCCSADGMASASPQAQTVPAGRFFFLGDNPDVSADSRKYGWADIGSVAGRVGLRTWPVTAAGGIGGYPKLEPVAAPAS